MAPIELPGLPAPLPELVDYIADNPKKPLEELMGPYRKYEAQLRTVFAQDRRDPRLDDPHVNVLPLFTDKTDRITIRARDLAAESQEEKDRYIMALPDDMRRPHASPATVGSLKEFQKNFGIFSENSLAELDWDNVVAAGSSVVNCLLPVPDEFNSSKRQLREYYHKKFCPASDVDLFLYGLNEEEAIEKIKKIERAIRDSILSEVTVVRTKYAITIASQYPTRHVQVVLRSYKSVSEILTGFDIDAAGGAYDGKQVYVTPRALGSFITQINQIDLSRRSPSYENRLSKYSHRNFEVYWPELDRSKVDPTIFERSFGRTLGLARLLVLERLPTSDSRESYLNQRRKERGRPTIQSSRFRLRGNIKDNHEDEIADWVDETEVANYHTFTVPYGEFFHAKKIEKLCYTKDLLLNAEWNLQRDVYLHRHPAFFGRVEDVIEDCCGHCPKPVTPEEIETAEKDAEIYISGRIKLLIDDPGRQQIGSFNPLTEDDWTDMAYVGNTARLCQSIVDSDVDEVMAWLSQPDVDVNRRDHTGRTPLQLAVICSTPDVVKCLIDNGARLIARMADGQTALHLAATRGVPEIVKLLMEKSVLNEEVEEERQDQERKLRRSRPDDASDPTAENEADDDDDEDDSDMEIIDEEDSDDAAHSLATGSFVKLKAEANNPIKEFEEPNDNEPDFYKIDVLAWDIPTSPLHLAIVNGHEDVVKMLCDFGGDALLPIKLLNSEREPCGAILTLALAAKLPLEKAKSMAKLLLDLGATSSQADLHGRTPFHDCVETGHGELVDVLLEHDQTGRRTAINQMAIAPGYHASAYTPIQVAINKGDLGLVLKLINAGAILKPDLDTWIKATNLIKPQSSHRDFEHNKRMYERSVANPLIVALQKSTDAGLAMALLEHGADPSSMTQDSYHLLEYFSRWRKGETALDIVRGLLKHLRLFEGPAVAPKPVLPPGMDECIAGYVEGTYQHWVVSKDISHKKKTYEDGTRMHEQSTCRKYLENDKTTKAQLSAVKSKIAALEKLEAILVMKGAKTFAELHPDIAEKAPDIYRTDNAETATKTTPHENLPYKYKFKFVASDSLTGPRRAAYVELFEAAWRGDLEKIKSLTLGAWGEGLSESPLEIAARDQNENTPFSLAFFLGHYDVAWAIAEIAHAQYSPPEEEKRIYELRMGGGDVDDDGDSEAEYSSDDDDGEDAQPRVTWKNADNNFTIDNVGEVSMQVKSRFKALQYITSGCNAFLAKDGVPDPETCLRSWNFFIDHEGDGKAFQHLLDLCIHFGGRKYEATPGVDYTSFTLPNHAFKSFVEAGKVRLLKEVIRRTGAGIPLDDLVKKTGVEVKAESRFYQGLSVYGKKRSDWATAGRETFIKPTGLGTPPLLHAAAEGQREAVEWFLSDEPLKLYLKYSQSKAAKEDSRIAHLAASPGGFRSAVTKWLGDRNELVLHCAVMGLETNEGLGLVEHLIETYPAAVDAKDKCGNTPLLTAAYLGRVKYMKLLIDGGADQSAKNNDGQNVIHRLLGVRSSADKLKPALVLLDKGLRRHLFKQRQSLGSGGRTPLHALVGMLWDNAERRYKERGAWSASEDAEGVVRLLLEYSRGAELEMLDASGETPLHTAVMASYPWLVEVLVRFRPKLMYIENAVGRTPVEVALSSFMSDALSPYEHARYRDMCYAKPEDYLDHVIRAADPIVEDRHQSSKRRTWTLCCGLMEEHPDRRQLVSLHEASDVANRLSGKYTSARYFAGGSKEEGDEETDRDGKRYLVRTWLSARIQSAWKAPVAAEDEKKAKEEARGEECDHCGGRHIWSDKRVLGLE